MGANQLEAKKRFQEDKEISECSKNRKKKNSKKLFQRVFSLNKIHSRLQNSLSKDLETNKIPKSESLTSYKSKTKEEEIKKIENFSDENLIKISSSKNSSNSMDDISGSLSDTNCGSSNNGSPSEEFINRLLTDDGKNENDEMENFDEIKDEDLIRTEDSTKNIPEISDEQIITDNLKTVFIENRNSISENSSNNSFNLSCRTFSSTSSLNNDYELNFYRNEEEIRKSYLAKLICTKVWTPNQKPKTHNSIIIFDWDDTLLPTTFLTQGKNSIENVILSENDKEKISQLENLTLKILNDAISKGEVYIITNAGEGWVEYSAQKFYPSINEILSKIKIVSARTEYEKQFPNDSSRWKIQAFLNIQNSLNLKLVTNILCLGDSLFEMEAGRILASKFKEAFIKTVKFREGPKLDELIKQLKLVASQFDTIYSSAKSLTIRVEKRKKQNEK